MSKSKKSSHKKSRKKGRAIKVKKSPKWYKDKKLLYPALAVLLITFICFIPALPNDFVNWDDDRNFFENRLIVDLNNENFWKNIGQIFVTPVIGNYNPLPIFTFAIEKYFFGLDQPFYWHLNNVLLHLICTFLVYRFGLILGLRWQAAVLLALFFGIHPMRVESVAWVTERKDVLFGAFYMAALNIYAKRVKAKSKAKSEWVWIYLFFILSLFSKIQAVTLPLSMLAVDYWFKRSLRFNLIIEKIPLFLGSLAFGMLGVFFLGEEGSLDSNSAGYSFIQRIFVGTYSFLIYIVKSVAPFRLSPLYPYPHTMPWFIYASAAAVPIYIGLFYYSWKKQWNTIVFGFSFFIFNIIFLLQVVGAGQGFLADRFTYIAYIGLFFIMAYYWDVGLTRFSVRKNIIYGITTIFIIGLGFMTWNQNKIWKNSDTLWTHVLKYYQNITLPYGNRANYYRDNGMIQKALQDYSATINLKPEKPGPYNSRARLFFKSNSTDTLLLALNDYNRAIELDPSIAEYFTNRAAVYARINRMEEALTDLSKAIELDPTFANAYLNRSVINNNLNNKVQALSDIESFLQLRPYTPDMLYESARLKRHLNRSQEALEDLEKAIRYKPTQGLYYYEKSINHFQLSQFALAKSEMNKAIQMGVQVDPNYAAQVNAK